MSADERTPSVSDRVRLGEVNGVFGVRGEVRLFLENPTSSTLRIARDVVLVLPDGRERACRLRARSGAGKRVLGIIDGVQTPEQAAGLLGAQLFIARSELPEPEPGEYYVHDLVGLPVLNPEGTALGVLTEVMPGVKDVWVLDTDAGEKMMIASLENVLAVDLVGRRIVVSADALSEE